MNDRLAAAASPPPAETRSGARPEAPPPILALQIVAVVILVGWALHATASVSALIAAAVFIAIVMAPLDRRVRERMSGRWSWLGHLVVFLVLLAVFLGFAGALYFAAQRVVTAFPQQAGLGQVLPDGLLPGLGGQETAGAGAASSGAPAAAPTAAPTAASTGEGGSGKGGLLSGFGAVGGELAARLSDVIGRAVATGLRFTAAAVAGVVLMIFLALILLVDAPHWRQRVERVLGEGRGEAWARTTAVIGRQLRRYLLVRAAIGVATAVLYMLWLWLLGVELVLVWGLLAFLLNFIPNLGSVLSGLLPTLYVFLTRDLGTAILIGLGLTAIEQAMGNFVDPRVQGRELPVSSTVILVGLLVFAWIWGVPGALLATPVLIAAVMVFARVEPLRPVALLLSNQTDYAGLDEATGR